MQDLQKLTDKLSLLEELVSNEEDSSSLQCLLDNPTIGQMYKACRDELPKLLELANSELNEDLMMKIISITERLTKIKHLAEKVQAEDAKKTVPNTHFELRQSSDDMKNIFDDLPLLSPKSQIVQTSQEAEFCHVKPEYFKNTCHLLIDLIKLNDKQVLRIMNITSSETLTSLKMVIRCLLMLH